MQDLEHPPDTAALRPGTLPPIAKTWVVIFAGVERLGKELGLPMLCLLAVKWGLLSTEAGGYAFIGAIGTVLGGNFALRKGEQQGEK